MKLLITGASGLLGLNLALEALRGHSVTGVDRGTLVSPPFRLIELAPGVTAAEVAARTTARYIS